MLKILLINSFLEGKLDNFILLVKKYQDTLVKLGLVGEFFVTCTMVLLKCSTDMCSLSN